MSGVGRGLRRVPQWCSNRCKQTERDNREQSEDVAVLPKPLPPAYIEPLQLLLLLIPSSM